MTTTKTTTNNSLQVTNLLNIAKNRIGSKYVLGANVPKDDADYKGPFDCAEFVAWANYQAFGILYGTDTQDPDTADAYTGYFARDAESKGIKVSVELAARTPGAMLLRIGAGKTIGHIVFSDGQGGTVEAMGSAYGVRKGVVAGRRWDCGILLPDVEYKANPAKVATKPPLVVYLLQNPPKSGEYVKAIQSALGITADGIYGRGTVAAVVKFQMRHGLTVDGEVAVNGETAKALKL